MPPPNAPDVTGALAVRFAADLGALCDLTSDRVLVAVSGGPDSVALLLLTHEAIGDHCVAATVDHGLRAESGDEAAWVADLCARRGIRHEILRSELPDRAGNSANISARARALRYALLETQAATIGADRIATAHHADDQLETMVMRLNRGAGLSGLAGVRAASGKVIRPLLGWRHADLVDLVAAHGIVPVDDPSNVSDLYDRARLRKALAQVDWLAADRWAASARALGDAEHAIEWSVDRIAPDHLVTSPGEARLHRSGLPFEIRRRLVERAVRHVDPAAEIRGPALLATLTELERGARTMLGNVVCTPKRDGIWHFTVAPPRRAT